MKNKLKQIKSYLRLLKQNQTVLLSTVEDIRTMPTAYKTDNVIPDIATMTPFKNGETWGQGKDTHAWFAFNVTATAPDTWLRISTDREKGWDVDNPQFILYFDGKMVQGLDINHRLTPLPVGKTISAALYAYTGAKTDRATLFLELVRIDPDVEGLYYDLAYPYGMLSYLDEESTEYARIINYLWHATAMLNLFDLQSPTFGESVRAARAYLGTEFYGKYCRPQSATTVCVGHTHIDCAWLWTLKQTREKVQRSFSTVLALMEQYPEYRFTSSQAFLYKNLKEEAPEVYEQVAERIRQGRWECEGAMWVEADCNLTSGESLIRQILYGKRFFMKEFGKENSVLWLPDVFGYSAALPQILDKSGIDWFVTSKISWNDTNKMPHDTFLWRGIDGTEIKTAFITGQDATREKSERYCTYVGHITPKMVAGTYKRYSEKSFGDEALLTYGYGDGGGGPTREDMEYARRGACGIPGSPTVKLDFVAPYLDRLAARMQRRTDIPHWQGELYLEFHRGTLTTMARNKRANRYSEFLYQDAELLDVTASTLFGARSNKDTLHRGWEMLLTNQFHDIIPGSSIKEVYDQSDIDYKSIMEIGEGVRDCVTAALAAGIDKKHGYVVRNPHAFTARGLVKIDGKTAFTVSKIPAKGYLATNDFITAHNVKTDGHSVETDRLTVRFDEAWQIVSIYDKKAAREVLQAGAIGGELRVYADYPNEFDAWEWSAYSLDRYQALNAVSAVKVVEDGARLGIHITRPWQSSTVTQTVWFYDGTTRIDFETIADWHEHHQMLRTCFPVDINADKATFEVQFGTVERPTHKNTSWDAAKFEVCAHKYADLSDGGYGVAILNDCKYGHDIHDGVISLSLLRSPTYPNPEADQGEMRVIYAIMPHEGRLQDTDVIENAYYLNYPMTATPATGGKDTLPLSFSLVSVDKKNVICETVKEAEDGDGIVLRLYECENRRTKAELTLGIPTTRVLLCDMLEREIGELPVMDGRVTVPFKGFEIITLKLLK